MSRCDNPFHLGTRPEWHDRNVECIPLRLASSGLICDNKCHTHPETVPKHMNEDGLIRLFDVIVNGEGQHLPRITKTELTEVADYYLGIRGEDLLNVFRRRHVA